MYFEKKMKYELGGFFGGISDLASGVPTTINSVHVGRRT